MEYPYAVGVILPFENVKTGDMLVLFVSTLFIIHIFRSIFAKDKSKHGKEEDGEKYKGFRNLPGPRPFPIRFIGNALQLPKRRDMHRMMDEMYAKYGPCYRLTLLNEEIVCLNTAPLAQVILGSNDLNYFRKGEQYDIYFNGTEGIPMLSGEKWRTRRKMISGSFKYKAFQRYNPSFNKHTEKLVEQLDELYQDGGIHTINDVVKECVFKQSSEAILGVDISEGEGGAVFAKSLETYLNIIAERLCKPWLLLSWVWRFHPLSTKQNEVFNKMINVTKTVLEGYKHGNLHTSNSPVNGKGNDDIKGSGNSDFVSMIEVMLKNGVTDKEIFEEVAITLAVAHDTTAEAMQIALFLLALHPDHQETCRAEADELFSNPTKYNDGNLQFSALPELKHLERCILESSRMLSLASILMRKLDAPLELQEGLVIPAGVSIYVFPTVIHKNPEYFPKPEKFDPDRFLPEPSKQRHPYAFLSFSAGPRNCIGTKLALIEAKMMIAKILHKFVVTTPDKYEDIVVVPSVIPGPEKPIRFIFKRRNPAN